MKTALRSALTAAALLVPVAVSAATPDRYAPRSRLRLLRQVGSAGAAAARTPGARRR